MLALLLTDLPWDRALALGVGVGIVIALLMLADLRRDWWRRGQDAGRRETQRPD